MAGIIRLGAVLALVFIVMTPAPSEAFDRDLAQAMANDAIAFCPGGLRAYLGSGERLVIKGMLHGDAAPGAIDPMAAQRIYDALIQRMKQKYSDTDIFISFGALAFFLSETVSPGICRTLEPLLPEKVVYDGNDMVNNAPARIASLLQESKPFHGACDSETVGQAYNIAVNAIVDFWVSAYERAGLNPGELIAAGSEVDHTRQALYSPEELAAMQAAEKARKAAEEAMNQELKELSDKGIITKEVMEWRQRQEKERELDRMVNVYNVRLANLERDVNEMHRQGGMHKSQLDRMHQLDADITEIKSRLKAFEQDPEAAMEKERRNTW